MSDVEVKPSTLDVYITIRRLSSPNDESNWDNWQFAMRMMLRGKNLEYVIEGGFKEGYNNSSNVLPDATAKADNRQVSSIIASRVHEENYATISPCQDSARRMCRALESAHQNNTAGGRYMHLRAMMTTRADSDEEVSKLITTMDTLRQHLLNVCPERTNQGHKTPIELYTGHPPSMRHAHVFGAKGVYLLPSADRRKLDDNSRAC